jgi:hypothetical protein
MRESISRQTVMMVKLLHGCHYQKLTRRRTMNKLGINIPEQPSIPPLPKKKAAVNRQVIVTWFTPEEKLPEEDIGVLATVTARAKNREFIRAILTVFYCKSEGWYELDYGFSELTVHAWCDLEPYEGD